MIVQPMITYGIALAHPTANGETLGGGWGGRRLGGRRLVMGLIFRFKDQADRLVT